MKKRIFIIVLFIVLLLSNFSCASYHTVAMEVVEEPICTIDLAESSKFQKEIIHKDLKNKEITLQLEVTNQEKIEKPTGEIMLVLDNSDSMLDKVSENKTRKDLIFEAATTLVSKLLQDAELKIGIVGFSTNTNVNKEGTLEDASLISGLSNDVTTLTNSISHIETNGPRTNLQAGLLLASQQFTPNNHSKYMIVLTDGVPNVAIDYDKIYYSDNVIKNTKEQLQACHQQEIQLITMLTGIADESYVPVTVDKNFGQIITEIFGTQSSPTAGSFYYIADTEIEPTITDDIYKTLVPTEKTLTNLTIVDYFPEEIVKNFDFAYVSHANIGNVSPTIDTSTNSITWTIPALASGQTAIVQYQLKLKENFDSSLINKILNTNEKVTIQYTDFNGEKQAKSSSISPKIRLSEPANLTTAPYPLPKAGRLTLISFGILSIACFIYSVIRLILLYKKTN